MSGGRWGKGVLEVAPPCFQLLTAVLGLPQEVEMSNILAVESLGAAAACLHACVAARALWRRFIPPDEGPRA